MTATRRIAMLLVLAGLMAGACSGAGDGEGLDASPTTRTDATSEPTGTVPRGEGGYVYQNAGLTATVQLQGTNGTLEVVNETGHELARPDLYVLDARDGHEILGRVIDSMPIADGGDATFAVSFPPDLDVKNIGLLILLIGNDNYGAFVPQ